MLMSEKKKLEKKRRRVAGRLRKKMTAKIRFYPSLNEIIERINKKGRTQVLIVI